MRKNIAFAFIEITLARNQRRPQQFSDPTPTVLFRQEQCVSFAFVSQGRICAGREKELADGRVAARSRNHQGGGSVVIRRIDVISPPKMKGHGFFGTRKKRRPEHGTQSSPIKLPVVIHANSTPNRLL